MILTGRVASGHGDLARWMRMYAPAYQRATGVALHPGSLNVVLDAPWQLPADRIRLAAADVGRDVNLVPCTFMGTAAFIFRTDNAEAGGSAEHCLLEILSPLHLRSAFDLVDGMAVVVEVPAG